MVLSWTLRPTSDHAVEDGLFNRGRRIDAEEAHALELEGRPVLGPVRGGRRRCQLRLHESVMDSARVRIKKFEPSRSAFSSCHLLCLCLALLVARFCPVCRFRELGRFRLRILGIEEHRVNTHGCSNPIGRRHPVQVALGLVAIGRDVSGHNQRSDMA
eukprot:scaffold56582_cov32-Tisochrysis_lutea.AAC.4